MIMSHMTMGNFCASMCIGVKMWDRVRNCENVNVWRKMWVCKCVCKFVISTISFCFRLCTKCRGCDRHLHNVLHLHWHLDSHLMLSTLASILIFFFFLFACVCISTKCKNVERVCKLVCETIVPFQLPILASSCILSMGGLWMRF